MSSGVPGSSQYGAWVGMGSPRHSHLTVQGKGMSCPCPYFGGRRQEQRFLRWCDWRFVGIVQRL
eukprot:4369502-Alexandrium_andersonii.AAC.1